MMLTERIKIEALRLGFHLVGITTPDPPPHSSTFESWLAAGRHGEMAYLATERARQRRADPRQILPECKAILVLGMRYPSPAGFSDSHSEPPSGPSPQASEESPLGRMASYAWGEDYHDILPERLKGLLAFIEQHTGCPVRNRWYTDTGPILERDFAQRAGLGWIGKNTCLIHPSLGSYFLLSEILLDLELEPDPPFLPDRCGSCTRCIDTCPTSCILPDRTIDARRCISYLTIELKGPIPEELRPALGEWVFGCDVCQEVCPWNQRFANPQGVEERQGVEIFSPRPGLPRPDLVQEMSLSPQTFNQKFKGSPVKRARRRGYMRNVAVALGNQFTAKPNPKVAAALRRALVEDPEPLVRQHAAWALGQMGGDSALRALQEASQDESDPEVLSEINSAISRILSN